MGSAYFDAHSLWQRDKKPLYKSLSENLRTDVCVVGAGIAGLSIAYELLAQGLKVTVLDRERLGLGETGLTTAHLSNALDDGYRNLQKLHGFEGARLAAQSHTEAIAFIERMQATENIDCEFERVNGYLFLGPNHTVSVLQEERKAAQQSGLSDVRLVDRAKSALFDTGPCLVFPRQAQFHPLRYLDGLAEAVERNGGQIYTHAEVSEIFGGTYSYVKTSQGFKVEAENIVVATNAAINNLFAIHTKNPAYRSYVVGVTIPSQQVDHSLFWDTSTPYHYLRMVKDPTTGEDILLVGGEDHRTGQDVDPEEHFRKLERWINHRMGIESRVVTRWSGQILEPVDGLAYIGRNPGEQNVFIVTGDSGHGLTHGSIAGPLIRDLILKRENPYQHLYDPSRFHYRSLGSYVKAAAQSTFPYSDWLLEGDVPSVAQIPNGEGAVIREGLSKVAVYKDEVGRLHACSAVCTHLGGIVRWNGAEKTWDCPCHGSRFDRFGEVVNGPANHPLVEVHDSLERQGEGLSLNS